MEGVDVIYWINLKRAKERKNHMEKLLSDKVFDSVEKIKVNAVESTNAKAKFTFPLEISLSLNSRITEKEYACLASHLDAIRMFSTSKFETAIILEDDVSLDMKPYWKKTIKQVMEEAPKDWEILRLQHEEIYQKETYSKSIYPCYNKRFFKKNNPNPCKWSAAAYLIHKRAALKLMRLWDGKKYRLPPNTNHLADYLLFDLLTTYTFKAPYFLVRKNNNTYIQKGSNRTIRNRIHQSFLSKMKTRKR